MSLVSNLISGNTGNFGLVHPAKYTHETGALRIATESAEALHEIFVESFYNVEQAELSAIHEGVSLESSQYQAVIEASVSSGLQKIKEFFKKLWEKVKAFFHAVKRYIDSIFMSGKEFVKKYSKDIKNATNLKDFEYKMFKYTNLDDIPEVDVDSVTQELLAKSGYDIKQMASEAKPTGDKMNGVKLKKDGNMKEAQYEVLSDDEITKAMADELGINGVSDAGDFDTAVYSYFRDGAESKDDKEDITVSSLNDYTTPLINFNASKLDKVISRTDKAYSNAIKNIEKAEKESKSDAGDTFMMKYFREYSKFLSTCQGLVNKYLNSWKAAAKERDSAYKSMIVAAISYSNKKGKNK